jgi:hypothetical protein
VTVDVSQAFKRRLRNAANLLQAEYPGLPSSGTSWNINGDVVWLYDDMKPAVHR